MRRSAFPPGIAETALTRNPLDCDAPAGPQNRELLAQIAALLGEPEAAFFQGNAVSNKHETMELLRLWFKLRDSQYTSSAEQVRYRDTYLC